MSKAGVEKMNLINQSPIPVELVLDLRNEEDNPEAPDGIECLDVIPDEENDAESILHSVLPE